MILPTYNEAGTIAEVIERVLAASSDVSVLVVDDGSPDGTGKIVDALASGDPRIRILHRPTKAGLGPAYIAGFKDALTQGYDVMVQMDSDLSHDPADVARLLVAITDADVAICSRYVPGGSTANWSRAREILSHGANFYARTLLRFDMQDATSGFRCYRRAVMETIPWEQIRSEGYGFQLEVAWRAWADGFTIVEVPIVFTERREGESKMSRAIILEAAFSVLGWAVKRVRRPAEPHPRSVSAQRP